MLESVTKDQNSMKRNILDLTRSDLSRVLRTWDFGEYHVDQVWSFLYRQHVHSFGDMIGLRRELQQRLSSQFRLSIPSTLLTVDSDDDTTRKSLLRLDDNQTVETVVMRYPGRSTACISTQIGCAMGCLFCATGQMGFTRHLSAGEIVVQVLHAHRLLKEGRELLRNVVFMGMGEPLHNYEAVMQATKILTDDKGLAIGPRFITISTVGLPPAIRRLADEPLSVNLAVSLHATTDIERAALIPVANRWSIAELMDACHYYTARRGRRIFFEWAMISGENDSEGHAHSLGKMLKGLDAHVNLIPLNPTIGFTGGPSHRDSIKNFQTTLTMYGVPSTIRQRRGIDINAGCGQLRARVSNLQNSETTIASQEH